MSQSVAVGVVFFVIGLGVGARVGRYLLQRRLTSWARSAVSPHWWSAPEGQRRLTSWSEHRWV